MGVKASTKDITIRLSSCIPRSSYFLLMESEYSVQMLSLRQVQRGNLQHSLELPSDRVAKVPRWLLLHPKVLGSSDRATQSKPCSDESWIHPNIECGIEEICVGSPGLEGR